jgi:hypothetical protein
MRPEVEKRKLPDATRCPFQDRPGGGTTDGAMQQSSETLTNLSYPTIGFLAKEVLRSQNSTHHQRTNLPTLVKGYLTDQNCDFPPKIERSILSAIFIELFIQHLSLLTKIKGYTIVDMHPTTEGMSPLDRLFSVFQLSRKWDYIECARNLENRATKGVLAAWNHFCSSCDSPEHSPLNPAEQKLWSRFNQVLEEDTSPAALSTPQEHIAAGIRTASELHWSLFEIVPSLFNEQFSRLPKKSEAVVLYRNLPIFLRSLAALSQELLVAIDHRIVNRFPFAGKLYFAGLRPETLQLDKNSGIISIKPDVIGTIVSNPPNQDTEMIGCPVLALAGVFQSSCELHLAAATKHLLPLLEPPLSGRILLQIGKSAGLAARSYSKAFDYCFDVVAKRLP